MVSLENNEFISSDLSLNVILPNFESGVVTFGINDQSTIDDLCMKIFDHFPVIKCIHHQRMVLLHRNKPLDRNDTIASARMQNNDTIRVILKFTSDIIPSESEYISFIHDVYPRANEISVSVAVQPRVLFHAFNGICVQMDGLRGKDMPAKFQSMLDAFSHPREAALAGFVQWTSETYSHRVFLLEIDKSRKPSELVANRYHWNGLNNGYVGGDIHSWQRYTSNFPVECRLAVQEYYEDDDDVTSLISELTLLPLVRLKYDQKYAILLANNVITVPVDGLNASILRFASQTIQDDQLFFFTTSKAS